MSYDDRNDRGDHTDSDDVFEDHESGFSETTSKSTWDKIKNNARFVLNRTLETADKVAHRSRTEMEIAQLKLRLRNTYARAGELIFRLREGEESENPFDEREVQSLFNQIRSLLGEIEAERQRMRDMKDSRFEGA